MQQRIWPSEEGREGISKEREYEKALRPGRAEGNRRNEGSGAGPGGWVGLCCASKTVFTRG